MEIGGATGIRGRASLLPVEVKSVIEMENNNLPKDLLQFERELAEHPLFAKPENLRDAVLNNPQAKELLARNRKQIPALALNRTRSSSETERSFAQSRFRSGRGLRLRTLFSRRSHTSPFAKSTVALSVMAILAWCAIMLDYPQVGQKTILATFGPMAQDHRPVVVGRVTSVLDGRDGEGSSPHARYDYITVGQQMQIASGLLEITHNNGARVVLFGPATYTACLEGGCLSNGKAVVQMPSRRVLGSPAGDGNRNAKQEGSLIGIRTPALGILDSKQGEEFGVMVDGESGQTEVHVFRGVATVSPMDSRGRGSSHPIKGQSAIVATTGSGATVEIGETEFSPQKFSYRFGR